MPPWCAGTVVVPMPRCGGHRYDVDECAICLRECTLGSDVCDGQIVPCGHSFCVACIERLIVRDIRCPVCRSEMQGITSVSGLHCPHDMLRSGEDCLESVTVALRCGSHAGVTMTNEQSLQAVRVVRLTRRDAMSLSGIVVGDVILTVNNVRVRDHRSAIALIDAAARSGISVTCMRVRGHEHMMWKLVGFVRKVFHGQ